MLLPDGDEAAPAADVTTGRGDASATVGLVGLGHMGAALAVRLAETGAPVRATSATASTRARFVEQVAGEAEGTAQRSEVVETVGSVLGQDVGVVLVSVPSGVQGLAVVDELLAAAPLPRVVVDTSTTTPEHAREMAAACAAAGVGFLDAPVSGGPQGARQGTLSVMAGGSADDLAAARDVLGRIGALLTHCGPVGSGQVAKACNQMLVTVGIAAVAETLTLARAAGADAAKVREALLGGWAASRVLEVHGDRMLRRDFEPGATARTHAKDVSIIRGVASGAHAGQAVTVFEAAARLVEQLAEVDPDSDHSGVLRMVEEALGRPAGGSMPG